MRGDVIFLKETLPCPMSHDRYPEGHLSCNDVTNETSLGDDGKSRTQIIAWKFVEIVNLDTYPVTELNF